MCDWSGWEILGGLGKVMDKGQPYLLQLLPVSVWKLEVSVALCGFRVVHPPYRVCRVARQPRKAMRKMCLNWILGKSWETEGQVHTQVWPSSVLGGRLEF